MTTPHPSFPRIDRTGHPVRIQKPFGLRLAVAAGSLVAAASLFASSARAYDGYYDAPRFRFGLSAVGGGVLGHIDGGLGGIEPRFGIQLSSLFGLYFQGQWLVGGITSTGRNSADLAGFSFNQIMVDFTLFDTLQLGVGPSLDFVWGCNGADGGPACTDSQPYFGADGRIAVVLGGWGRRHRRGVALSLDVHPTVLNGDAMVVGLFGIGGELY